MFSSQINFKFPSISEAQIAAKLLTDMLCGNITTYDFHGLHISVSKEGDLAVSARFESVETLQKFEKAFPELMTDIKSSFVYTQKKFTGVCVYAFEREAMAAAIPNDN